MSFAHRRSWFAAIAILLVLLFITFNRSSLSSPATSPKPYAPSTAGDHERFRWDQRKSHYPVTNYKAVPTGTPKTLPSIQASFGQESAEQRHLRLERRQKVEDAFSRCWRSYREKAWMFDELSPISGSGRNSFGGWSATLVDALDTLWIMGMKQEFQAAVQAANDIDFTTSTDTTINIFETTIRYLGGFLAAHDLSGERSLLDKAVEVGEMVLTAFDTPNRMPVTRWEWKIAKDRLHSQEAPDWMLVSELGSLSLEFTRLSQVTGDPRWYDAIARITDLFDAQQHRTKLPGMWPVVVNPKAKDLTSDTGFTLGGMSDSLYEYFPKAYALLGGLEPVYQKLYTDSMATAVSQMFFRPMSPNNEDILMSGDLRAQGSGSPALEPRGQHLTCFAGGMLGLGGRLFSKPEHVDIGRKLTEGCIWAYQSMPWGIMPEIAHFVPCASKADCPWDKETWLSGISQQMSKDEPGLDPSHIATVQNLPQGFTKIDDRRYILRPEAIESVFIYYRITGDRKYQNYAWDMFNAIQNVTTTKFANAAIPNIASIEKPVQDDRMESFWLAETLKYFYLIFSEPDLVSLDEYVLNTEAHPFKRPK